MEFFPPVRLRGRRVEFDENSKLHRLWSYAAERYQHLYKNNSKLLHENDLGKVA